MHKTQDPNFEALTKRISFFAIRGTLIIICVSATLIAFQRPNSLTLLTHIGTSAIASGTFAPIVLAFFWPHAEKKGAITGFIIGSSTYIVLRMTIMPNSFKALVVSSFVSLISMIVISKFSHKGAFNEPANNNKSVI